MLFTSFSFLGLTFVTFFLYYLPIFRKKQTHVLIASSLIFYSSGSPKLLSLLIFSIIMNILTSYYAIFGNEKTRKFSSLLGVVLNLSVLVIFKYSHFIGDTFFDKTNSISQFLVLIPLPIGISFITFHGISLVVDSYRSDKNKELTHKSMLEHIKDTFLYLSFFPKILAGPIERSSNFLPQIKPKRLNEIDWELCFKNILSGYFLKMVIADNLKNYTFYLKYPYFLGSSAIDMVGMIFGYSIQIFADFAGYSLIAIGIAGVFGYKLNMNFNFPYISQSFSEFWRRWHISLSSFLKDYLYIPLGGNRKGSFRTYLNLMIVMFLGGLWHGAAWSFAAWGTLHGLALALERFIKDKIRLPDYLMLKIIKMAIVFTYVSFAWLLFLIHDFSHVMLFLNTFISKISGNLRIEKQLYVLIYSLPVVIYHVNYLMKDRFSLIRCYLDPLTYGTMLFLILTNSGSSDKFVYFQF